jgi:hypothetical protein
MTITISNLSVNYDATAGTIIGVLTTLDASGNVIPCAYALTKSSSGRFAISDNKLVSAWKSPTPPGHYSIRVRSTGLAEIFSGSAAFTVTVDTVLVVQL